MYSPFSKLLSSLLLIFIIYSCTPRTVSNEVILNEEIKKKSETSIKEKNIEEELSNQEKKNDEISKLNQDNGVLNNDIKILNEIEIILPSTDNKFITKNFINSLELSAYKKNINNLSFNVNVYSDELHLQEIISKKIKPGKIFLGPLTSKDTKQLKKWCSSGVIFFSFASDRKLGSDCVYLINFFPEDELLTLFNYFNYNSRIVLLYPENKYGYYINSIIDNIAAKSNAVIINRASYKEDLTNARKAIKELSKYEVRRYELERQKKLLQGKNDEISKKALKKIERFETIGELEFTHIIIPDHNIRLLEITPLLPFYDVDPNKIQFVGTGVWDDEVFFNEPSLQGAIFPGISKNKREDFIKEYIYYYNEEPIRTITIIYDLVGLLNFMIEKHLTVKSAFDILNDTQVSFEGIDGKFSFENNLIKRDLEILQIFEGSALSIE